MVKCEQLNAANSCVCVGGGENAQGQMIITTVLRTAVHTYTWGILLWLRTAS